MKKSLLLFSLFVATTAYCQAPKGFSIAAGANQTYLNADYFDTKAKTGWQAGVSYAFGESPSFNYQADLLFNHGAFDLGYRDAGNYYDDEITRNSVDLLLHFNYYLLKPQESKFYAGVQGGVFAGYGEWDAKYEFGTPMGLPWPYMYEDVTKFNYGISPGIVLGYDDFKLSVKYNIGLNNALDGLNKVWEEYDSYYNYKGKLNSLTLTAYYRLL